MDLVFFLSLHRIPHFQPKIHIEFFSIKEWIRLDSDVFVFVGFFHLIAEGQSGEGGQIFGPFDGHEEQPRRRLVDAVGAQRRRRRRRRGQCRMFRCSPTKTPQTNKEQLQYLFSVMK